MNQIHDFIQNVLLEVCLDSRINSGVIEISNQDHIEILAEHLFDRGMDAQFVMEVVNSLIIRDGKYPDRQAYNKDGWLVTFPSADYRNAAIKKGTHFSSDPTHGKGGMHLYYKKKGKQSRQKQQGLSSTEPVATTVQQPAGNQSAEQPVQVSPEQPEDNASVETPPQKSSPPANNPQAPKTAEPNDGESSLPASDDKTKPSPPAAVGPKEPSASSSINEPAPTDTEKATASPSFAGPSIVDLSKKFALEKQWVEAPYGEWHNSSGEKVAVTGLDAQVVPLNYADRETLKLFVKKNSNQ